MTENKTLPSLCGTKSPKSRPKRARALTEAIELQRLLMEDARGEIEPNVRAQVVKAWQGLQELRLRMNMKPAPKPIDVSHLQKDKRKRIRVDSGDPGALPAAEPLPGT